MLKLLLLASTLALAQEPSWSDVISRRSVISTELEAIPATSIVVVCASLSCKSFAYDLGNLLREKNWDVVPIYRGGFGSEGVTGVKVWGCVEGVRQVGELFKKVLDASVSVEIEYGKCAPKDVYLVLGDRLK